MNFGGIFLTCLGANFLTLGILTFSIFGLYGWYKRKKIKNCNEAYENLMKGIEDEGIYRRL